MEGITGLFDEIENRKYDTSACFLCGTTLDEKNRTDEHVFPKWLQRELALKDEILNLPNNSTIKYKSLKIPCCAECNNHHLSSIERKIHQAFKGGYSTFSKLDYSILYLWMTKIYFGLCYNDMFHLIDQKDPSQGTIITEEYIRGLRTIYQFLQEARGKHVCKGFVPASIFVVQMQNDNSKFMRWDFMDRLAYNFIALRMKDIGIIAVLYDCGVVNEALEIDDFYRIPLHPIQFNELCALIFYNSLLLNRTPNFISIQNAGGDVETHLMPLGGFSTKPFFDDWNWEDYNEVLSSFTGYPYQKLMELENCTMTWIHDNFGNINNIPIEEHRFVNYFNVDPSLIKPIM